jgi:hypothetical protein
MGDEIADLRAEIAQLRDGQQALALRAQRAEDHLAILNLQAAYGYYVDKGLWDKAADLFAKDATLEIAGRGVFEGRERVREYLHHLPPYGRGILYNHMQLQPVIHVDAEAGMAQGRWRSFMQVGALGAEARWGDATYENNYVREDGRWRIARLYSVINFYVEYEQGWHRDGVKLLRSIEGLKPDRPPSMEYEAYPEPVIAPFHYDEV